MPEEKGKEKPKVREILDKLVAAVAGAYWQLGLGFMGWQTVAPAIRSGILSPLDRAFTATYRYRNATAANVARLWVHGLIGTSDFVTYLKNLGFDDTAIAIIVNYYAFDKYEELAKEKIDRLEIDYKIKRDRLKEEIDFLEDVLSLALGYTKTPEKRHRWRLKEYEELLKLGPDKIRDLLVKTRKELEDLERSWEETKANIRYFMDSDLITRVWKDVPAIRIEWYGITEFLKPTAVPAPPVAPPPKVKPPVAALPTVPYVPPAKPPVKPPAAPIKTARIISPTPGSNIKVGSNWVVRFAYELESPNFIEFRVRWSIDLKADKYDPFVKEILKNFPVRKVATCVYEVSDWIVAGDPSRSKGEAGIGYFNIPKELAGRKLTIAISVRGKGTEKLVVASADYNIVG